MSYDLSGLSHLPEYQVYQTAKDRCTNPNSQRWHSHGERGIEMRFQSFTEFLNEVGTRPSSFHSIERINNDGHYEPGNVKWATRSEQQRNRRSYTHLKRKGKGYNWHKASGKWIARIKINGKLIYLGLFTEEKDAAAAYSSRLQRLLQEKNAQHT